MLNETNAAAAEDSAHPHAETAPDVPDAATQGHAAAAEPDVAAASEPEPAAHDEDAARPPVSAEAFEAAAADASTPELPDESPLAAKAAESEPTDMAEQEPTDMPAAETVAPLAAEPAAPEPEASTPEPAEESPHAAEAAAPEPTDMPATDVAASSASESPAAAGLPVAPDVELEASPALPLFSELGLSEPILRAVEEKGYRHPTPIQAEAIPAVLAGRDVLGVAQTGTGKTAGFTLPMLHILAGRRSRARMPRSLILEPTRELALQVAENFVEYGKYLKLSHALLIGGESMNDQKAALNKGVDVLIATPGRLLDLFERGGLMLTDARLLVIDEADRMLDMGFIPDVEKIVSFLPADRQTLFFSATMAGEIRRLADAFLRDPQEITVSRAASVAPTITTGLVVVAEDDKRDALRSLIASENVQNALIFCNRKRDVDILYKSLQRHGFSVGALHGDMSQPERFATLAKFKANELRLLVCSDVAARGIDIGGLSHVFNFDVPHHAEDYVHRIGRTGRAGLEGHAYTIAAPADRLAVEAVEALTGNPIARMAVAGVEPLAWEEGDGKRRGRRGAAAPRSPAAPRAAAATRRPRRTPEAPPAASGEQPVTAAATAPIEPAAEAPPLDLATPRLERLAKDLRPRRTPAARAATDAADQPAADAPAPDQPIVAQPVAAAPVVDPAVADQPSVGSVAVERHAREPRPARENRSRRDRPVRGDRSPERVPRAEPRPEQPRPEPVRAEAPRQESPRYEGSRSDAGRRDYRRRDEDLGPSVLGFGDEVPTFMLLPRRQRPIRAELAEDVEA